MSEYIKTKLSESVSARWIALILVSLTMLAAYFFVDMMAPLQSLIQQDLNWTPTTYGFFSGSEYLLNMLGFLIISGIILDKMGIRYTGLLATSVMLFGGLIKFYGLTPYFQNGGFGFEFFNSFMTGLPATAKVASIGYAIFGIGVEMTGITVSRSIVKWFKGKELALAMGMEMATARMGASVAFFFSAKMAGVTRIDNIVEGNIINPIYFGLALLSIGLLCFVVYNFMDARFDKETKASLTGNEEPEEEFRVRDILKILTNRSFFYIALLCVLFYSGIFPFLKYAVNMMENRLGIEPNIAGNISALLPVGTIVLTPLIGYFLDTRGKGATMMIFGAVLLTVAHLTFALAPLNIALAITAIVVLGIAFSLVPASMWPSVPKIVEERYLGSAYALIFWIQNIGLTLIPMLIGYVLQVTNPGIQERLASGDSTAIYNYKIPMLVFAFLGVLAIIFGFLLKKEDKRMGYGLELPNKKS